MSERAEPPVKSRDTWQQADQDTTSPEVIAAIYKSIWTDRKPSASATLTDMERLQYERQNSAGLATINSDCAGQALPACELEQKKAKTSDRINDRDLPKLDHKLPERACDHALRSLGQAGMNHEMLQPRSNRLAENNEPYLNSRCPNYYDKNSGYSPLDQLKDLNRHDDRARMHQPERLEDRTQKVCYPDGSSRVVLRNQKGEITLVVNPDGSRLERHESENGKAPEWEAYGRHGTPIVADTFRGHVAMSQDGTFQMIQIYPVPQMYEQKPDGSYRHAYKGGAKEQWTASKQTDTILYPNGKAREIKFNPDTNGILRESAVTNR